MPEKRKRPSEKSKGGRRGKKGGYSKKPDENVLIAKQHICSLLEQARESANERPDLADRYVTLVRKIAMKFRVRLSSEQKRSFCPHCYRFLVPGKNLRVRVHEHKLIYYCLECKRFWRKPLIKRRC